MPSKDDMFTLSDVQARAPFFARIIDILLQKSPLQKKALMAYFATCDETYWQRVNVVSGHWEGYLERYSISLESLVTSYLNMCHDSILEQIKFAKTGRYSLRSSKDAFEKVYSSESEMTPYMHGLAFSIFTWPNHYAMYDFFIRWTQKMTGVRRYLEIGPGHGMFLLRSLETFAGAEFSAIDISPISARISERFVRHCLPDCRCRFEVKDASHLEGETYDFIVMGEVLEHVDCPAEMLTNLRACLEPGGTFFITTCANCPAVDHIYLYHDAEDIRRQIRGCGFTIEDDLELPVENIPLGGLQDGKIGINYAAILRKEGA